MDVVVEFGVGYGEVVVFLEGDYYVVEVLVDEFCDEGGVGEGLGEGDGFGGGDFVDQVGVVFEGQVFGQDQGVVVVEEDGCYLGGGGFSYCENGGWGGGKKYFLGRYFDGCLGGSGWSGGKK